MPQEKPNQSRRWWDSKERSNAHEIINTMVSQIEADQNGWRLHRNIRNIQAYRGRWIGDADVDFENLRRDDSSSPQTAMRRRLLRSIVNAGVSKMLRNLPRPMVVTQGSSYKLKRQADLLDKWIIGLFQQTDFYAKVYEPVVRHGCVEDIGSAKVFEEHGKIRVETVFANEVLFDEHDSFHDAQRQRFQPKIYDRDVLLGLFPKQADAISKAPEPLLKHLRSGTSAIADQVRVNEAWKLPSKPVDNPDKATLGNTDGRRAIVIDGATLLYEPWPFEWFPFSDFVWEPDVIGPYGISLADDLYPIQSEMDNVIKEISVLHKLYKSKMFVPADVPDLDNDLAQVVTTLPGLEKPEAFHPVKATPEQYAYVERLDDWGHKDSGFSQFDTQGTKPAGLDAAVAIRAHFDRTSMIHIGPLRRAERFVVDVAKKMIAIARMMNNRKGDAKTDLEVVFTHRRELRKIKWSEVEMPTDSFQLKVFPASSLPDTPAERLQTLTEWVDRGWVSSERAMDLAEIPDLETELEQRLAPRRYIEFQLEKMLDEGEAQTPESYQPLDVVIIMGRNALQTALMGEVDSGKVKLLQSYIAAAEVIIQAAQAAAAQQQAQQAALVANAQAQAAAQGAVPPAAQPGAAVSEVAPLAPRGAA